MKDALLVLQASTTKTTDYQSTAVTAPDLDNDLYGKVVVNVTALDATTGDETYIMYIEVYDGTTWRVISGGTIPNTVLGKYEFCYSGKTASKMAVAGAINGVRVNLDVGGTTPSITFEAYLAPL